MNVTVKKLTDLSGVPVSWGVDAAHGRFDTLLSAICWLLTAAHVSQQCLPSGIAGRVEKAFINPTSGGLRDLARFLATKSVECPAVSRLSAFVETECADSGWFGRFVVLRNKLLHAPHSENIICDLAEHLRTSPDLDAFGFIQTGTAGSVEWQDEKSALSLVPFFTVQEKTIISPIRMSERIWLGSDGVPMGISFLRFWQEVRRRDPALDQPTSVDFRLKGQHVCVSMPSDAERWWASSQLRRGKGPTCFFVENEVIGCMIGNPVVRLHLHAGDGDFPDIGAILSGALGLADRLSVKDLSRLASEQPGLTLVTLDASQLSTRGMLRLIEWVADLADVRDANRPGVLAVFVSRSADQLVLDDEVLFERLPPDMERVLRIFPMATHTRLIDFQWPAARPANYWKRWVRL